MTGVQTCALPISLLAVCNLSGDEDRAELPQGFAGKAPLIANLPDTVLEGTMVLRPWEAFAVLV